MRSCGSVALLEVVNGSKGNVWLSLLMAVEYIVCLGQRLPTNQPHTVERVCLLEEWWKTHHSQSANDKRQSVLSLASLASFPPDFAA